MTHTDCRDAIIRAGVNIQGLVRKAMFAHGTAKDARVIPILREIDHYLFKIEAAVKACRSVGEEDAEIRPDKSITLGNM